MPLFLALHLTLCVIAWGLLAFDTRSEKRFDQRVKVWEGETHNVADD